MRVHVSSNSGCLDYNALENLTEPGHVISYGVWVISCYLYLMNT